MTYAVSEGELAVRRKGARAVFRRLVTGEEESRSELFDGVKGCADWWQGLFLKRLESLGIVEKIGGRSGRYVKWRLARTDEAATFLQALSTDDEALATLLNGVGGREGKADGENVESGGEFWTDDGAPGTVGDVGGSGSGSGSAEGGQESNGVGGESADVRLDFALKLLAILLENAVYMREGVDELKGRMASLEEAFK